ncbi:hypothetical protein [Panacagrimonas sp.]|uniref:hypothetical protein n=1 Tax=Panacagrimonas sp. TaxID=2480088 RepID=UPI003B515C05
MTTLQIAFLTLAAVAAGGVLMTALIVASKPIPAFLGPAHGLAALAAVGVLFAVNLSLGDTTPVLAWWALGVFVAGLVGGLLLFRVLFKDKAPLALALAHGSVGALGLYLLYGAAFA